jgi:uncharacterized protein YjaG (DUF416 family)
LTRLLKYDEAALAARLEGLEPWQRSAFALSCAQRMLPVYLRYSDLTAEGDAAFIQSSLATLWEALDDGALAPNELQLLIDRANELVPPGDAVGRVIWHYYAANAVAALIYAMECQKQDRIQEAVWAALQPYDVITSYVDNRDHLNYNSKDDRLHLERDPLVQAELQRQETDLKVLEGSDPRQAMVKRLRDQARQPLVPDLE